METRNCQNCKKDFAIEPDDFSFYEKISVPPPTFCPRCRTQRRMAWRNEHFLFKKEDIFGKSIFSGYHPDSPVQICDNDYWWSDARDATEQGREYDFSQPFFEQFKELFYSVAIPAHINSRSVDSEYTNNVGDLKNCYLCFNGNDSENCAYCVNFQRTINSVDATFCSASENLGDTFNVTDCHTVVSSIECADCVDVSYSYDCRYCQNCIACAGLRHKSYCINNIQYTKDEYIKIKESLNCGSYNTHVLLLGKREELMMECPRKYLRTMKCQDVSGEYIYTSKNVKNSYACLKSEDMRYCQDIHNSKDAYDCLVVLRASGGLYENTVCGLGASDLKFSFECHPSCLDLTYCIFCSNSSHLLGCVGLRNKEYCIFNKQYTKEEYDILVPSIIAHMNTVKYVDKKGNTYSYGEFFPSDMSPFAYNETIAQEYFPLERTNALSEQYVWRDSDLKTYVPTISNLEIPDSVYHIPDTYVNEIVECSHKELCLHGCSKAFKVRLSDLDFYKKMQMPFPRECPNCRLYQRLQYRNHLDLYTRICMCTAVNHEHEGHCQNMFETSYSPDRPEIVYCEKCYQQEMS